MLFASDTALKTLENSRQTLQRGELAWSDWNKLSKLAPGKKAMRAADWARGARPETGEFLGAPA